MVAGGATVIGWYCTKDLLDLRPLVETDVVETDVVETDVVGTDAVGTDTAGTLVLRPLVETDVVGTGDVETDAVGTDNGTFVGVRSNSPVLPVFWIILPVVGKANPPDAKIEVLTAAWAIVPTDNNKTIINKTIILFI